MQDSEDGQGEHDRHARPVPDEWLPPIMDHVRLTDQDVDTQEDPEPEKVKTYPPDEVDEPSA